MDNEIIQIIVDKQYKLDKIIVGEIHGKKINKIEKEILQKEIKLLNKVLKFNYKNIVYEQRRLLNWMKKNHYLSKTEEQLNKILTEYKSTLKN